MKEYKQQKNRVECTPRSSRRKYRHRWRIKWTRLIFLFIIISATLIGVCHCLFSKPNPTDDAVLSCYANGKDMTKPSFMQQGNVERKQEFYTILVSGEDDGNGGSDTNILVAFDAKNHAIDCVSIPRDTGAYINGKVRKINSAYNQAGTKKLAETVSDLLGIPVDYTIAVNLKGFASLVDTIGGVDFDVPINMDYDDPRQDLSIHFTKGMQHLNGQKALEVIRFRHNNDGSGYGTQDLGRIGTQQAFLKTISKQTLTISNADKILKLTKIFHKYVNTNLTPSNLAWLGKEALSIGCNNITFSTLEGEWRSPYYRLDTDKVLKQVNSKLNPYKTDRMAENLNIPL